jgi:arylsulfatase
MEGVSLTAAFRGEPLPVRMLFWEHQGNAAVRHGEWKAVRPGARGEWMLFNLSNDRTETEDLAAAQPDRIRVMASAWDDWAKRVAADPFSGRKVRRNP